MLRYIKPVEPAVTRLYILDSSFNPPTNAHLQMINSCPHSVQIGHLLLIANSNVDKSQDNFNDRIEMLQSLGLPFAITSEARFVDKAKLFEMPTCFVLGYDTLIRFFDRKYYGQEFDLELEEFFRRSKLRVVDRGENDGKPLWERKELHTGKQFKNRIEIASEIPGADVSSSLAREYIAQYYKTGSDNILRSLKSMVPEPVLKIILEKNLYH